MNIKLTQSLIKIPNNLLNKYYNKSGRSRGTITIRYKKKCILSKTYKNIDYNYANQNNSSIILILSNYLDIKYKHYISLYIFIKGELSGKKRLITTSKNIQKGDILNYNPILPIKLGSTRLLLNFPIGTIVHNVENIPKKGATIARSAGTFVKLLYFDLNKICIKLPSGHIKLVSYKCKAIIGVVANVKFKLTKAGDFYNLGKRPKVRGIAKNPIDHPHGGGVGKSSIGLKSIKTPWGKYSLGVKTRKYNKIKSKFIIKS